jgi:hypothetical protein
MLNIYVPQPVPADFVFQAAARIGALKADVSIRWVEDETEDYPSDQQPTYRMRWNDKEWILERVPGDATEIRLGTAPAAADVKKQIPKGAKLVVQLPPTTELSQGLPLGKGDAQRVVLMKTPAGATYALHGRINNGKAEYAWTLRDASAAV